MKAVVETCSCAVSLGHLDFRLCMFGSHGRNQGEFTISLYQEGSLPSKFLRKLFVFRAYVNLLDHLDYSMAVFYQFFLFIYEANFSPYQ